MHGELPLGKISTVVSLLKTGRVLVLRYWQYICLVQESTISKQTEVEESIMTVVSLMAKRSFAFLLFGQSRGK